MGDDGDGHSYMSECTVVIVLCFVCGLQDVVRFLKGNLIIA